MDDTRMLVSRLYPGTGYLDTVLMAFCHFIDDQALKWFHELKSQST
jgi:hypothetical protein